MMYKFFGSNKAKLEVHNVPKYEDLTDDILKLELDGVEGFDVITGEEGYAIGAEMEESGLEADPHNEYLVIHFENGETGTYRNSFVDLFRL